MNPLMTSCRTLCLCLAVLLCSASATQASQPPPALLQTCVACHGQDGIAISDDYPNLAGQKVGYLESQIRAFRDGERDNPAMAPLVQNLSDNEIAELARYYASLPAATGASSDALNMAGKHVRARCVSCHGMQGKTVNREWPNLAGQNAAYMQKQLLDFKSGARPSPVMAVIAQELTDQEIADVSEYYSQQ